jgi:hypothetical protein
MIRPTANTSGWERVAMGIERVRQRLLSSTRILEEAGIPYAVIGGNAVAEWVGRVDDGAVRFTKDVDLLIRRVDLPRTVEAMTVGGYKYSQTMNVNMFIDVPDGKPSEGIHLLFADEKVKPTDLVATPSIDESEKANEFQVISFDAIVRMKLTSFRDKDRVHLRDMIGVGLIDRTRLDRLPTDLSSRLAELLDNPE